MGQVGRLNAAVESDKTGLTYFIKNLIKQVIPAAQAGLAIRMHRRSFALKGTFGKAEPEGPARVCASQAERKRVPRPTLLKFTNKGE